MSLVKCIAVVTLLICVAVSLVHPGVPARVSFQGVLTDKTGKPVEPGTYTMRFRIYDHPTATGPVLWESFDGDDEYVDVEVADSSGIFSYLIGTDGLLPDSLIKYDSLWLAIRRGSDQDEMTPRTPLVSVVYAFRSDFADSSGLSEFAASAGIASYADSSGVAVSSVYSDTSSYSETSARSDSANHADIADTANYVRSGDYRLVAYDQTPFSYDSTDWTLAGSTSIPPGVISEFVLVEMVFKAHSPGAGTRDPQFELRIGEEGLEVAKLTRTYFHNDTYITAYSTHSYVYEPSASEKVNGFNIQIFVRVTEYVGDPVYSALETFHVFGK